MDWGKWIIVSFVLFVAFIATLVTVCVRQDISLVTKDYYQDELAYQDQLDRLTNTKELVEKPSIKVTDGTSLEISFAHFNEIEKGKLQLFFPSNEKMDRHYPITASNERQQYYTLADLPKGMYRARLQWTMHGKEFYMEEIIYL
jgi:hypothetical protein